MNSVKCCPVRIAVREGPQRPGHQVEDDFIKYTEQCKNSLIVDGRVFPFDYVYGPQATQQQLYDTLLAPLVDKVLQGFNCTALAYGQTGTGKSYTMGLSRKELREECLGMVPRCLVDFFKRVDGLVSASFIEIYNEKCFDLLAPSSADPIIARGHKFTGGTQVPIKSLDDFYELFERGTKCRHVRPTPMNSMSSRSHAIFTVHLKSARWHSRMNIVDLAGSEGVRRTGHQGIAMSEGVHINQGLLCLNKVVHAMASGHKVIPYRDSVLTLVLQDSLSASSYLTLLACISPHMTDLSETVSTIRFAQGAKQLKQNPLLVECQRQSKYSISKRDLKQRVQRPLYSSTALKELNNRGCNSFCTPSKVRRIDYMCNQTAVGLTPKEKQKAMVSANGFLQPINQDDMQLDNSDPEGSLTSLNMSTSTELDAPASKKAQQLPQALTMNHQLRLQIQSIMDAKMQEMLAKLQQQHFHMLSSVAATETVATNTQLNDDTSEESSDAKSPQLNLQCATFSPAFKVPNVPLPKPVLASDSLLSGISLLETESEVDQSKTLNSSGSSSKIIRRNYLQRTCTNRRFSKRIAGKLEESIKIRSLTSPVVKRRRPPLKNTIIGNYLNATESQKDKNTVTKPQSKATKLDKHREGVLSLLNTGSMSELQILPQIGKKTAYQLVVSRTLNGDFKTLAQVEKLPLWRGGAWQRFVKANYLD